MLKLRFDVKNQFINRVDKIQPSADSQYYLYAHFNFLTDDWKGKVITAVFAKDEKSYMMLVDIDGDCEVPHEVIKEGNFYVSVFADTLITGLSIISPMILKISIKDNSRHSFQVSLNPRTTIQ